jgi:acetoacetyl-CoA synthetase
MTKTPAVELLIPIWQRVLQRSSIRVNDNFFGLGGNPASAAKLFGEIAEVCGRHLSPVLVYSVPTIEALAAVLEQPDQPRVPPLLLLKAGTQPPPIFIAHGLGDTVLDLFQLVEKIESAHPIYGIQARGVDGVDEPLTSVEAMAQFHLEAIKQLQPHGPYFLIGYSLGGLVALEIAQRLSAGGEKIALLALVESYPHRNQLGLVQRMLVSLRLAKRQARLVSALAFGRTRSEISAPFGGKASQSSHYERLMRDVSKRMRDSAHMALKRYRPQFYRGEMRFVRAEIGTIFPDDPVAVWSDLAEQFEIETIPGDHWSVLTTGFDKLASTLTDYLHKASA